MPKKQFVKHAIRLKTTVQTPGEWAYRGVRDVPKAEVEQGVGHVQVADDLKADGYFRRQGSQNLYLPQGKNYQSRIRTLLALL